MNLEDVWTWGQTRSRLDWYWWLIIRWVILVELGWCNTMGEFDWLVSAWLYVMTSCKKDDKSEIGWRHQGGTVKFEEIKEKAKLDIRPIREWHYYNVATTVLVHDVLTKKPSIQSMKNYFSKRNYFGESTVRNRLFEFGQTESPNICSKSNNGRGGPD